MSNVPLLTIQYNDKNIDVGDIVQLRKKNSNKKVTQVQEEPKVDKLDEFLKKYNNVKKQPKKKALPKEKKLILKSQRPI